MAVCGRVGVWAHNIHPIPKTCVFSHYDIAQEFGFQPITNGKQMKYLRPTLFYAVPTRFCELSNGNYDYCVICGEIRKG